jgi:ubiquitin-protein ligase
MNPRLYQRIRKEINIARDAGYQVSDLEEKELPGVSYPTTAMVLQARIKYLGKVLIVLSTDYPFRPPKILANNNQTLHDRLGRLSSKRFQTRYETLFQGECLYCDHKKILGKEWSPMISVLDILRHIEKMVHIRHTIFYNDVVWAIQEKHDLPEDIPIMSFVGIEPAL